MTPARFYALADVARTMSKNHVAAATWDGFVASLENVRADVDRQGEVIANAEMALVTEDRRPRQLARDEPPASDDIERDPLADRAGPAKDDNFISILSDVLGMLGAGYSALTKTSRFVRPPSSCSSTQRDRPRTCRNGWRPTSTSTRRT